MKLKRYLESIDKYEDDYQDDELSNDEGMDHICSLLRKMYKASGVNNVYVERLQGEGQELDVRIFMVLNKTEKIKSLVKSLDVTKKIADDILIQYDSDFELWETQDGNPLITVSFYHNPNVDMSQEGAPF